MCNLNISNDRWPHLGRLLSSNAAMRPTVCQSVCLSVQVVLYTSICSCSSSFGLRSAVQHEAMAYGMLPCRPAAAAAATAVDMSVMYRLQCRIFECRVHALFCANIK